MRRGKPWTDDDVECAHFLRHCGLGNADIGLLLSRSRKSVDNKIGYDRTRTHAVRYELARPSPATELGALADFMFLATYTAGTA